ncbi:hypothetical protein UT300012_24200 [Paraclostridium bifermentans]
MTLFSTIIEALVYFLFCTTTSYCICFGLKGTKIKMDYAFTVIFLVLVLVWVL